MEYKEQDQPSNDRERNREPRRGGGYRGRGGNPRGKPRGDRSKNNDNQRNSREGDQENKTKQQESSSFPVPQEKTLAKSTDSLKSIEEDEDSCPICIDPITFWAIGTCNHRKICALCSLRRRMLYKQNECPLCRQSSDWVIITKDPKKTYEQYDLQKLAKDDELKVYFDGNGETYFKEQSRLWALLCPYCDHSEFKNLAELKVHTRDAHQLQFCNLCLKERKVFLQEQKLYNQKDLKTHNQSGDRDTQVKHEKCDFCRTYFYDKDKIYEHLNSAHESCFICDKAGKHYQYYRDYSELEKHFGSQHFLCNDDECRQQKFVVFTTEKELHIHNVEKHLANKSGSRSQKKQQASLKVDIVNTRNGSSSRLLDSGSDVEEETKPLDVHAVEQFPSLEGQSAPVYHAPSLTNSWARVQQRENFPSLPGQRDPKPSRGLNVDWGKSEPVSQSKLSEMDVRLRNPFPIMESNSNNNSFQKFKPINVGWTRPPATMDTNDFPSLPGAPSNANTNQTKPPVWGVNSKPNTPKSDPFNSGFNKNITITFGGKKKNNRKH